MSDVDEIINGLRENAITPSASESTIWEDVVTLADAEAAVRAAVDARTAEILGALCAADGLDLALEGHRHIDAERRRCAKFIARRFPNGGTNDDTKEQT